MDFTVRLPDGTRISGHVGALTFKGAIKKIRLLYPDAEIIRWEWR